MNEWPDLQVLLKAKVERAINHDLFIKKDVNTV